MIEFFRNDSCDASGNGEGQTFLGFVSATTDATGNVTFSVSLPATVVGQAITSTATDPSANTSEFSACRADTSGGGGGGSATPLALSGFSGAERIETLSPNFGRQNSPVVFNGVTYTDRNGSQLWSDTNWGNSGYFSNFPNASNSTAMNDLGGLSNLQIDFSVPVNRAGIFAGPGPTMYTMTAYDDSLTAIGNVTQTSTDFKAVFLGLQATTNIKRVVITETGDSFPQIGIFDDLRYENWTSPEILRLHVGNADPLTEGFTPNGGSGSPSLNDGGSGLGAWRILSSSTTSGYYSAPLTGSQKLTALTQGWKLTSRARVESGDVATNIDFFGVGNRFDIHLTRDGNGDTVVTLATSILPVTGPSFTLVGSGSTVHVYELVYDPSAHTADLFVDGVRRLTGYAGMTQFQSDGGLMMGSSLLGAANGIGYDAFARIELLPAGGGGGGENEPPVANAGSDQTSTPATTSNWTAPHRRIPTTIPSPTRGRSTRPRRAARPR